MLVKCLVQWLSADPSCHLHSTDTPEFWEEEEEEDDTGGSASVSMTAAVSELEDGEEEEDEEDAATVPGEETGFKMCAVLRQLEKIRNIRDEQASEHEQANVQKVTWYH